MSKALRSELIEAIHNKTALLLTGTGVSLNATSGHDCASWIGLIKNAAARAEDIRSDLPKKWMHDVDRLLKDPGVEDLIAAAEKVTTALKEIPGDQFTKWLRDSVGALETVNCTLFQAIKDLEVPVCTTNYDTLLDDYLKLQPVTWRDGTKFQDVLRGSAKAVIHLHGVWSEPNTVVFGYGSYGDAIHHAYSQALTRAAGALNTLVFVGMGDGLRDPNFAGITSWMKDALPGNSNPPVALLREADAKRSYREITRQGVLPLSYGADYADLPIFLADIAASAKSADPSGPRSFGWEEVCAILGRLFQRIYRDFQPDIVLAMSGPGNFAPAYCLKHDTSDTPMICAVTFPKRSGTTGAAAKFVAIAKAAGWIRQETPKWEIYVPDLVLHLPPNSKVLLFDDRVVTGEAQREISALLTARGLDVKRAALITHPSIAAEMDFYELAVDGEYYFPWGGKQGRSV